MKEQVQLLLGLPDLMQMVMPLCNFVLGLILLTPGLIGWLNNRQKGGWICKRSHVIDSSYETSKRIEIKEENLQNH